MKETINAEEAAAIGAVVVAQHIPLASDYYGRLEVFKFKEPPTICMPHPNTPTPSHVDLYSVAVVIILALAFYSFLSRSFLTLLRER